MRRFISPFHMVLGLIVAVGCVAGLILIRERSADEPNTMTSGQEVTVDISRLVGSAGTGSSRAAGDGGSVAVDAAPSSVASTTTKKATRAGPKRSRRGRKSRTSQPPRRRVRAQRPLVRRPGPPAPTQNKQKKQDKTKQEKTKPAVKIKALKGTPVIGTVDRKKPVIGTVR